MKIIHYYTGAQVSDDELSRARAVRLEGHQYLFRDAKAWDGLPEYVDQYVSDDDGISSTYEKRGISKFDGDAFFGAKEAKPKRGRPKKGPEPVMTDPEPDANPQPDE